MRFALPLIAVLAVAADAAAFPQSNPRTIPAHLSAPALTLMAMAKGPALEPKCLAVSRPFKGRP